ncbi:hypothetical protein LUZ60_015096 [Juncus effusus]|nr:hypothetical protein LUZ60_015096 [Juncus effusus]
MRRGGERSPSPWKTSSGSDFSSRANSSFTTNTLSSSSSSSSSSAARDGGRGLSRIFSCFTAPPEIDGSFVPEPKESPYLTPRSNSSNHGRFSGRDFLTNSSVSSNHESIMKFSFSEIQKSTNNFSPSFKIGQGGSGVVYKAKLRNGTFVAVKRAKKSNYDKHVSLELQNEIQTMQQIEHTNLVKFYGYLEHEGEHLIIVEYVPNGTLRDHLDCFNGKILDFSTRLDIAIDVGHAITYLHTYSDVPFIHRDIKSTNTLITPSLRAKLTDFGFAKRGPTEEGQTHVMTQVKGTAGYLDPEYLRTYQLTDKSDVYSFGVLLVELVTGRRPVEIKKEMAERVTSKWAMEKFVKGKAMETLDPNITETEAVNLTVQRVYELAVKCLAPSRRNRPGMKKCTEILWNIRKEYRQQMNSSSSLNA